METTIRKLFSDQDRKYMVPTYQRSYSWEKNQYCQFIQDLREAKSDYYLGHFLFECDDALNTKAARVKTWFIIDGQQRLTTCLIFFSALLTELSKRIAIGDAVTVDIDDLEHLYLRDSRKKTQRMETVADDNNFFANLVIDRRGNAFATPGTKSQERIRDTLAFFQEVFEKEALNELERWHDLVAGAKCTHYEVSDKISAARIFAFQNDRGKSLANLEILKSYFMLQVFLHSSHQDVMAEHLKYLENEISIIYSHIARVDLHEDDVLLYCWQACDGSPGFNTRKTVEEIKRFIVGDSTNDVCERIKRFMGGLAHAFRVVERVETCEVGALVHLKYLDNMAISYPFLIKAGLSGATDEEFERLAKLLENITFRSMLRGGRAGIESRLNVYLTKPTDREFVTTVITGIVRALRTDGWWEYWTDKVMEELLTAGYFYQNRVDNYVLWRYELDLCATSGYPPSLKVGYRNLVTNESIEHIAPRTETSGGAIAAGYGTYSDSAMPENGIESGNWLNSLGNLLLISRAHNSSIGNKPFPAKLASYGADNLLAQQKELAVFVDDPAHPVWNVSAIRKRQQQILKVARRLWSLDAI